MTSHHSTFASLPRQPTAPYPMPVSTRVRTAKQDGAVPVEPAGSQQPNSDDDSDSNYNENENDAEGVSADGAEKGDDDNVDNVDSTENETDDTHRQAHNARSPAWRPWEDRLLVGQRTGKACKARFNVLRKKFKADETRSLQKTGTDEEIDDYIEV
ncbi:hypothetical protein B0H14DRAFT_3157467 [Mycena olivaceomarginata]|nr:hypothetical protein B0H14DRAFT_3157467 [Mycena olivaceomarginata]